MSFDSNPGTNKLARVLAKRMKKEGEIPVFLEFGAIKNNNSLSTDSFPVSIPKGEYLVLENVSKDVINPGDRVLVAWVGNDAVVIDVVTES